MDKIFRILIINPGSTSTKIALYANDKAVFDQTIAHRPRELTGFKRIADQKDCRKKIILDVLNKKRIALDSIDIAVGRGGLTRPVPGGIYRINKKMLRDVKNINIYGREHASNLGCLIAYDIAKKLNIPAVIMDPVATDDLLPVARISGCPEIKRKSLFHALNIKAVARIAAAKLRKSKNVRFTIAHIGGGISIACYEDGKIIDVNNAVLGMGPFSPQRAGSLPIADLVGLCYSGRFKKEELLERLAKKSGLMGYLGTDDIREIEGRIHRGDKKARLVFEAMTYQIAKEIGAYAAVFKGKIDAILLTGGASHSKLLMKILKPRISFLGRIMVFPGEVEMRALAYGGLLVLKKKVRPKEY